MRHDLRCPSKEIRTWHPSQKKATNKTAVKSSRPIRRSPGRPTKNSGIDRPGKETMLEMYEQMLLIRRFEEKAGQLYGMGQIGGFCHLYIGQEAVVVGMQSVTKPNDTVVTSYRDHGHMLACGMEANGVMAELTGREGGYSAARGDRCTCSAVRKILWRSWYRRGTGADRDRTGFCPSLSGQ